LQEGTSFRFECRIGHAYSPDALVGHQGEMVEAALWSAINSLQERAATFRRLAGNPTVQQTNPKWTERADQVEQHAQALLDLLRGLIADGQVG
jgi:two-component system chemotaxis response regulator CheB